MMRATRSQSFHFSEDTNVQNHAVSPDATGLPSFAQISTALDIPPVPVTWVSAPVETDLLVRRSAWSNGRTVDIEVPGYAADHYGIVRDPSGRPQVEVGSITPIAYLDLHADAPTVCTPSRPSPRGRGGVDLRDLTMTDGEFAVRSAFVVYQELGGHLSGLPSLKEAAADLIQGEEYQIAPDGDARMDGTKLSLLADLMRQYRSEAMGIVMQVSAVACAATRKQEKEPQRDDV